MSTLAESPTPSLRADRPSLAARAARIAVFTVPAVLIALSIGPFRGNSPESGLFANSAMQVGPARVCIVDLERVFDTAPQRATMEENLRQRDEEIKALAEAARAEIKRLEGELAMLQKGHDEYLAKERELNTKQADLRFQAEQWNKEMNRRVVEARDGLLQEIKVVVEQVCNSEGFDIVLQRDFKIPDTPVVWSTAFYARPEYDITDRVIAALQ